MRRTGITIRLVLDTYIMRTVANLQPCSIADFGIVVKIFVPADLGACKQWCIIINIYVSPGSFLLSYKLKIFILFTYL
jgi:hypothetical protein